VEEAGLVSLLEVDSALPMTIVGSFRPRLRLMWPAGLMTPNLEFDATRGVYLLREESQRFVGVLGAPGARDLAVMPYQEEPKDVPIRFELEAPLEAARAGFLPIVLAGSVAGKEDALATYSRILSSLPDLYAANVRHYRRLGERTLAIETPDPALDRSFAWAKVGVDKGLATNPGLGTGLLAGFRTSGDSERPGFGWYFGRDALWTSLALHAYGDFDAARAALEFLGRVQRKDGKVPHEISQSAPYLPWFTDYPYPWNSADATPLFVIAQGDHWQATGNRTFLDASYEAIVRAWRFSAGTDTDGNGLVENTSFGHGWVEGGDLYPPHEEIYQQGVWIEACLALAAMAEVRGDIALAEEARGRAEQTRSAVEGVYWLPDRGFYGFATLRPRERPEAEPGPERARRQARLETLSQGGFADESTVMPAVPMLWGQLDDARAQRQLDHLGASALATDWGSRLLASTSALYDPLSYHHGSVWPLFTGWTAVAAYRYGRPHIGYQALRANADLRSETALGYVTELLSGDYRAAFGRSSHHQIWSEAMVATPLVRGLLGLAVEDGGRTLRFGPSLPVDWDRVAARNLPLGKLRVNVSLARTEGRDTILVERREGGDAGAPIRVVLAPSYPLDAKIEAATRNGRPVPFATEQRGDVLRPRLETNLEGPHTEIVLRYRPGSDVYLAPPPPEAGARSGGLRILRSQADAGSLRLLLEGEGGRVYTLGLRSPRRPEATSGVVVRPGPGRDFTLEVRFEGTPGTPVRREVTLNLR
jgi:glycogen debranching enzyme